MIEKKTIFLDLNNYFLKDFIINLFYVLLVRFKKF
jgi:hypothetical protein